MVKAPAHMKVLHTLEHHNFEAYLVGGCVRDHILHRQSKDFDITTNALPEQVTAIFPHTVPVGAKFGVTVVVMDGVQVEVATYRADGAYTDGRRPDTVEYGKTAQDDVTRRDFTINGLLMTSLGDVIDHVRGREDINKKTVRCIGDPNVRFQEDALRQLRAVRFAAQLGFRIADSTLEAIERNAHLLKAISRERVAAELFKIFSAPEPLKGIVPFITTGMYRFCMPDDPLNGVDFATHANTTFILQRFGMFEANKDVMLGMAMFFADLGTQTNARQVSADFARFFKFSNEQTQALVNMNSLVVSFQRHLAGAQVLTKADLKRTCRLPGLEYALEIMTQNELMGKTHLGIEAVMGFVLYVKTFKPEDLRPVPFVMGQDLIDMGLTPGPIFTEVLFDVETAQLNGTLASREEALAKIKERVWRDTEGEVTHALKGLAQ